MASINDTLDIARSAPAARSYSQPFWNATKEKKLVLQFDRQAGRFQFYPRATSRYTGRHSQLEWREVPGRGEVYSFTIVRRSRPPFVGHEPFFLAVVELPEGVQIMGNTVGISLDDMKIGLKVKPYWHILPDGYHMLMWQKDEG